MFAEIVHFGGTAILSYREPGGGGGGGELYSSSFTCSRSVPIIIIVSKKKNELLIPVVNFVIGMAAFQAKME